MVRLHANEGRDSGSARLAFKVEDRMKLYGADVCPFVHRVRLVLAEKGLDYEYVKIDLKDKPDWYDRVLPSGRVPLLEDGATRIWESAIICEYLEEAYPENSLMPRGAAERAEVRRWIHYTSHELVPAFYQLLTEQDAARHREFRQKVTGLMAKLDREAFQSGPFLVGGSLSLADTGLFPWLERWPVLEHYRGLEFPESAARVFHLYEEMRRRASVQETKNTPGFYLARYESYANPMVEAS